MRLDVSAGAINDLRGIFEYSRKYWGIARARDYANDLRAHLKALTSAELSGVKAEQIGPGIRRQISGSHVIWFRVENDVVMVIRVLHQSRDVGRWVE